MLQSEYQHPCAEIMDVIVEGVLCVSPGAGTDNLVPDDSWSGIIGG